MNVEIVFITAESESLLALHLEAGATVADAIAASALQKDHPQYDLSNKPTGIWGQPVSRDTLLKDGDRVEIYRELARDPMEARRLRASD
jgi:putative ubiquitin-RnfH superfamily antitoxin RatB of RatAB toxin-antitoxin module